jgi:hypothetical protein
MWTGIAEIPRVRPDMLAAVLIDEAGRGFPGNVPGVAALRWEPLAGLFGGLAGDRQFYLVQLALGEAPPRGVSAMQALVRLGRKEGGDCAGVAVVSGGGCLVCRPGAAGVPELSHLALEDLGAGMLAYLEPGTGAAPPPGARSFDAASFPWRLIDADEPRPAADAGIRRWRLAALAAFAAMVLAGLLAGFRWHGVQADELAWLNRRISALSGGAASGQPGQAELARLRKEVGMLKAAAPVPVYAMLVAVTACFSGDDRILGLRWDGSAGALSLDVVSKDPLRLLEGVQAARGIKALSSSGIVPSRSVPGEFQCTVSCAAGGP